MREQMLRVEKDRFRLDDPNLYLICGSIPEKGRVEAFLDKTPLPAAVKAAGRGDAMERFGAEHFSGTRRVKVSVTLPEELDKYRRLSVYVADSGKKTLWFRISAAGLAAGRGKPQYYVDDELVDFEARTVKLRGWAAAGEPVELCFLDEKGQSVKAEIARSRRTDVERMFGECTLSPDSGFYAQVPFGTAKKLFLVMKTAQGAKAVYGIPVDKTGILLGKLEKCCKKSLSYVSAYGVAALVRKTLGRLPEKKPAAEYEKWLAGHLPSAEEQKQQKETAFPRQPKISVVVPLYKTREDFLQQLVDSVKNQTYENWELCLSDGSGKDSPIRELLKKLAEEEPRIRVVFHEEQLPIVPNTNAAIAAATGEFIAFADHDDMLTPDALFECVRALNEAPETEALYSDEDKVSADGKRHFQPHFKPDFNLDLLRSNNYVCHLFVAKRALLDRAGLLRPEYEGAQDYDLVLRCAEKAGGLLHVPRILYHWRTHDNSTSENPQSKLYAFDAGQRAVQAHFDRLGIKAEVCPGEYLGIYRTRYQRDYDPLVSIVIPNKDHVQDLERCLASIEEKSTYRSYEILIVENNSEENETFAYYEKLEQENPRVRVIRYEGGFHYSEINNLGAQHAAGEYLLLLNNDTEVISENWLEELLGCSMRPDVGITGARLYYGDDTVQHAGIILGAGGIAGNSSAGQNWEDVGEFQRLVCARDVSAVTAACLMVRKAVYEQVGGLSPELPVAFNDVDFCLKVQKAGYRVVYNPYAELYHYESKSRGAEDTPEKKERFAREIAFMESRWGEVLAKPDPYYNPNLAEVGEGYGKA